MRDLSRKRVRLFAALQGTPGTSSIADGPPRPNFGQEIGYWELGKSRFRFCPSWFVPNTVKPSIWKSRAHTLILLPRNTQPRVFGFTTEATKRIFLGKFSRSSAPSDPLEMSSNNRDDPTAIIAWLRKNGRDKTARGGSAARLRATGCEIVLPVP